MDALQMKTEAITIRETPKGWLNKHTGRYYKTAVGALRAIERGRKDHARTFGAMATILTWEPTSYTGSMVVRALL